MSPALVRLIQIGVVIGAALLAALACIVVAAPYIGLGENEGFFLYQQYGISRRDTLVHLIDAAVLFAIVAVPALVLPKISFREAVRRLGRVKEPCRFFISLNRNWMAPLFLLPALAFVLGCSLFILPRETFLAGDSGTYLAFSTYRTIGYPVFLRLVALLNSYSLFSSLQLLIAFAALLLLSEGLQRVFKNYFLSVGICSIAALNWGIFSYSYFILSDHIFFSLITFHLAFFLLALNDPNRRYLIGLAAATVLAISVRPAGLPLLGVAPFMLLFLHGQRLRLLKFLVAPLFLMMTALAGSHWYVFDYFGISKFGGYNTGATTMFLMAEDIGGTYPALSRSFFEAGAPYRKELENKPAIAAKYQYIIAEATPMINLSQTITQDFMATRPDLVHPTNIERHKSFVTALNGLSRVNEEIGQLGITANAIWIPLNDLMGTVGKEAFVTNLSGAVDLFVIKFLSGWDALFYTGKVPETFGGVRMSGANMLKWEDSIFRLTDSNSFWTVPFDKVAQFHFYLMVAALPKILLLVAGSGSLVLALAGFIRRRQAANEVLGLAYAFSMVLGTMILVCIGGNPIPRYLFPIITMSFILVLSPLLTINLLARDNFGLGSSLNSKEQEDAGTR